MVGKGKHPVHISGAASSDMSRIVIPGQPQLPYVSRDNCALLNPLIHNTPSLEIAAL